MNPEILIRADGSTAIGLGHLTRCFALAQMLKKNFSILFFCKEVPEKIKTELVANGFDVYQINNETDFIRKINKKSMVVLDGYHFDSEYQKAIKEKACKLICMDDLCDKESFADLIINHAPGIKPENYHAQPYTQFALGYEYALLRNAFLKQAREKRSIHVVETVLICFGGGDYKNLTESILSEVLHFIEFKRIIVVTGSSYKYSASLRKLIESDSRAIHYQAISEQEMLRLMQEAHLAIVPASGILYEALSAGCKIISGYYADNQMGIYNGFLSLHAFIDAKDFTSEYLIDSLRKVKEYNVSYLLDGKSSDRLLAIFNKLRNDCSDISG